MSALQQSSRRRPASISKSPFSSVTASPTPPPVLPHLSNLESSRLIPPISPRSLRRSSTSTLKMVQMSTAPREFGSAEHYPSIVTSLDPTRITQTNSRTSSSRVSLTPSQLPSSSRTSNPSSVRSSQPRFPAQPQSRPSMLPAARRRRLIFQHHL